MRIRIKELLVCVFTAMLLCSMVTAPAFADLSTGFAWSDDREENQIIERTKQEAAWVEAEIDALPDDAGFSHKDEIEAISESLSHAYGTYGQYRVSSYVSDDRIRKLVAAEERVKNATVVERILGNNQSVPIAVIIILAVWEIIWFVQVILAYGTAYRKTKANGDNGVSLFGWMLLYCLAAIIPGLGIYLWNRSKRAS